MEKKNEEGSSVIISMLISLFLVLVSVGFVMGFTRFLSHKKPEKEQIAVSTTQEVKDTTPYEYLTEENDFSEKYVMLKNIGTKACYACEEPGKQTAEAEQVFDGQIVKAIKKGIFQGKLYYQLEDEKYLLADKLYTEELKSYTKLSGYIVITYLNSSGVRVRKWADFEADNVVDSVYVGDQLNITGKVVRENGDSAFITAEGYYITTSTKYFNDYTTSQ